ncbi:hypothetical protein MCUN1_003858 [Malassezia cuniculi]|uniref:Uncharacterized protein n=1 Tax=Malassezia cuniculi TaxID=948313 RepID=A0AAF0EU46_9BASI|nr:hypothetical protein MCUN1_003858 [Malassezia cuniculi]
MRANFAVGAAARSAARRGPSTSAAPAQIPTTNWNDPKYAKGSRTVFQALALNAAPQKKLSRREILRRSTLHFGPRGQCTVGPASNPLVRLAPPVALPSATPLPTDTTEALRKSKATIQGLYGKQVIGGDYSPYLASSALKSQPPQDITGKAIADAAQALSSNLSVHPEARRVLVSAIEQRIRATK